MFGIVTWISMCCTQVLLGLLKDTYKTYLNTYPKEYLAIALGPVVQSIVSLTSSLRGQFVKCLMTL